MNALLLFREAERRASDFNLEDVNYAGDRLAVMGLYWHLCPNLRKFKQNRHLKFCFCFHLDQRKIAIPLSWVMIYWGQTGGNLQEHPMSLELFALPQSRLHKHRRSIRSERFYSSRAWVCRCRTHLTKALPCWESVLFHWRFYECE